MNRGRSVGRLITLLATLGIALGALPSLPVAASSARASKATVAAAPTNLGVTSFGRILVDPATSHVFVSSPGSSEIFVLDYNGTVLKTITGEAGAWGMALSGSTLYVVLSTAGTIEKIDTGTLTDSGMLVNGLVRPTDIFLAGSKLWTTTGNCANWSVQLVSIDPATNPPTVVTDPNAFNANNSLSYCAAFASNPTSNPNLLLAWDIGLSPATITSFDVSTGAPVQQASAWESPLGNLQDVAVNPDGTHFITASGAPYEFDEWKVSDLSQDGVIYAAKTYPDAVATTAGNGGLMGGGLNGIYNEDFYAYQVGNPAAPMAKVDFGGTTNTVPDRGVAFRPDGSSAFVVSGGVSGGGGPVVVNVVPIPLVPPAGSPGAPTGVTASPGIASASVSWTAPVDPGNSPVTSYTVTSSPGGITVTTSSTSTLVNGLTPGVSYTFTVTATNATGTGYPSAPSNAVVPWACGPPTNVSATPGDTAAYVTWLPPANPGSPITGYRVTPYVGATAQSPTTVSGAPPPTNLVVTGLTNGTTYTFVVAAIINTAAGQDSAPSNAVTPLQGGNYHPLTPARILDTRSAIGGPTQPLTNGEVRLVQITGQGLVPSSGVSAVVLNVTVTGTTSPGYLTVYPAGVARPVASNLNFVAGETVPNLVEVAIGSGGMVNMFAQFGSTSGRTNVIFDVAGWVGVATNSIIKDGLYNPLTPARIMDTRSGVGVPKAPVGPGQTVTLNVFGAGQVPASGVSAVVLNVTVTGPTAASYLTVYPADAPQRPTASNLNFSAKETVPNRVIVKVGAGGLVSFYNAAGSVQVIADVGGWFTDSTSTVGGARFSGIVPFRILDTRDPGIGPLYGGYINTFQLLDQNNNPVTGISALVMNVTVTNPTVASYLTLWPDGPPLPPVSDLNFSAGETVPNLVVVKLGSNATIDLYNALGRTDVLLDIVGFYGQSVPAPSRPMAPFSLRLVPLHRR